MKPLRLLSCATLVIAWFAASTVIAQTSIAEQQDARVIENLRQNGADVTKVHNIDFFLVFIRKADAVATAEKIRALGYEIVGIGQPPTAKQWEIHAKRKMVPELQAMQATTRALQSLAEVRNGYYDGWGAVGVK
ncbi:MULTISPECIES: ribonuclease E inhibitor RraB [unclassified Janthinobacterium]|uniref:ribonuclease E inhibitor RraB n=1 Tax=unclassified Janthinobacterium TaxID=2610881 RepID=UPI000C168A00|nr:MULTISPECIES: ribonuclease E inhibitor RraB [unclassified Janthinobacterium]MED5612723.1 ribonuclease E inhibitor RraB [Janthinobacterium sp. P210005]PIF13388.1 regulator of RNase E activity RraB [Janthinobacterium sp. 13]